MGAGERVVLPDFRRGAIVQDHVHARQGRRGVVHLLAVEGQIQARAALRLGMGFQHQRAGAAGGIVGGLAGAFGVADADDLGHDAGNLRRRVELTLALARFRGEVAHQVFVSVTQQVVTLGAVVAEIQRGRVEDAHQVGEPVHHLLAFAELPFIVEVGHVDDAPKAVGVGQPSDDLVDLVADFLVARVRHHVGKAAARGDVEERILLAGVPVGDVFHEQQDQDIVLVLRGIHAAAQLITAFPEGGVKFGFLDRHG